MGALQLRLSILIPAYNVSRSVDMLLSFFISSLPSVDDILGSANGIL